MIIEILRGISGSGKSTYANMSKAMGKKIISRDVVREKYLGEEGVKIYFEHGQDPLFEDFVTKELTEQFAKYVASGCDIVIDSTNLRRKFIQPYIDVLAFFDIPFESVMIMDFDISLEEAKKRVAERGYMPVSDQVIERQYTQMQNKWSLESFKDENGKWIAKNKQQWILPKFDVAPYTKLKDAPKALICDIDGTLAHRKIIMEPYPHLRSYYGYDECVDDDVDELVAMVINSMPEDIRLIFVSGRKSDCRTETEQFLNKCVHRPYTLFLRNEKIDTKDGQDISDDIVKLRLFNENIRSKYNVIGVIDDRKRVVALWEALGLKVLNVGRLNEYF